MARGAKPKEEVVKHLLKYPEKLLLTNDEMKHYLKEQGFYSRKTYWKDINVEGIRRAVEKERQNGVAVHDRVQAGDEVSRENRGRSFE